MKKLFPFITAIMIASTVFTGCKKSDDEKEETKPATYTCTSCATAPEAKAANDNSGKGVYKGVVIGSTGTIKFDVANNGNTITAILVIDGVSVSLTSAVEWVAGVAYSAPFTGTMNGQPVSITFSVGAAGASPSVSSSDIPGHANASFTIAKETSASMIEAFEGTYKTTKPEEGTFNVLLSRTAKMWGGAARQNGTTQSNSIGGTINANGECINSSNNMVAAVLSGDNLSGSFVDSGGRTVTVTGKRTL